MLREASGPINFTMFLNLFGEKLTGELLAPLRGSTPGQPSGQPASCVCVCLASS